MFQIEPTCFVEVAVSLLVPSTGFYYRRDNHLGEVVDLPNCSSSVDALPEIGPSSCPSSSDC